MMSTKEIAEKLVASCRAGDFVSPYQELYSPEIVSIEPDGMPNVYVKGFDAIMAKGETFQEMIEKNHGGSVSDPVVADNFFSCSMTMDVTFKGKPRMLVSEICVYEVQNGKIVKEQFFFTPMKQEA